MVRFSAGVIFILFSGLCQADTISINLTSTFLSGSPGSTIPFGGILSNTTGSTLFLNSAGINLAGPFSPADEDTSPFFSNAPLFLAGGDSTLVIDLFAIHIPGPFIAGPYSGTFTVLGGVDGNAQDTLGSADFTVQVANVNSVPEPSSRSLLIAACLTLLAFRAARCLPKPILRIRREPSV